jgi:hypothetical protein
MTAIHRRGILGLAMLAGTPMSFPEARSTPASAKTPRITLADFGFVGDWDERSRRGTDDTQAWRGAIAAAHQHKVGTIIVPWGASGASYVAGAIVDGPLPSGIVFEAEKQVDPSGSSGVFIVYGGSETCWNVDHHGRGGSEGRWTFRGLGFRTLDSRATMFDFNRATTHGVVRDADPEKYSALENIRFESCYFQGAGGGVQQTGDAIRGAKLFQMVVDETCFIRDFRRGIWLYGCDNCTISVRSFLCARSVMVQASGTFGNDNRIDSRFIGGSPATSSEDVYFLWDNGNSTAIHEPYLEELDHRRATALMYLDGYETLVLRPHMAGRPAFRLGPNARSIVMIAPAITRYDAAHHPMIDPPASWDFGYEQNDHRMSVIAASKNVQQTFGTHPRLLWVGPVPAGGNTGLPFPIGEAASLVTQMGYGPAARHLSALNWWAKSAGTVASGGIAGMVVDPNASGGWAIRLSPLVKQSGMSAQLVIGRDIFPRERLRVRARVRCANTAGWFSIIARGTRGFWKSIPILPAKSGGYYMTEHVVDLADWQVGEILEHAIYQGEPPRADMWIDFISYEREAPPE